MTSPTASLEPRFWLRRILFLVFGFCFPLTTAAQSVTYHLHREASSGSILQMKSAGPDAGIFAAQSANLKNAANGEYVIKEFDTQSGVPNASGLITAGQAVSFTLWLKKTASAGTMFPRVKLKLNTANGTLICVLTGSAPLTTTLSSYTLSGTVPANVSMSATDRFYLWVGVNLTAGTSVNNRGELNVEGTLDGNYDSRITIPLPASVPSISNLSPSSGPIGTSVSVAGTNFGATQGSSTVTFNGTSATPTSWSATSIAVPVPSGAITGPVVVNVNGQNSNGVTFTVTPHIANLSPTSGGVGTPVTISGSAFGATQGGSTVTFNGTSATPTSWSATSIAVPVPSGATTGPVVVNVNGQNSNGATFTVPPQGPGSVSYIYDGLGRLVGVVDPATDTAIYNYDSVGNLTSISRQSSSLVSVIAFSPPSGAIGTSVTIYGTGFSTIPSQNVVTFNGVPANVTSATATQISATVQSGTTTGPIAITTPTGSATSSTSFVVNAGNAPTISGFSPSIGTPNTPVTITGTNFDPDSYNNKTRFNITHSTNTAVSPTSISTTVPSGASSGRISVATPNGTAVSSTDFFIPPSSHAPSEVGVTGRMSIGDILNVVIGANLVGIMLFDGTAGQRVSVGMTNVTIAEGVCCPSSVASVAIYQPDNTPLLAPFGFGQGGHGTPSRVLPVTGTYMIVVDPFNGWFGGVTLTLSLDLSPPIAIGGTSVALGFNRPGQNGYVSFAGSAGQRVSVGMSDVTIAQGVCCPNELANIVIYSPDGTTLLPEFGFWGSGGGTPSLVLPMNGIYSILVNPLYNWTGNITVTVSEDLSPPISIGGPSVPLDLNRPGQNGYLTFSGTAGQRVSVGMSDVTIAQGICCPNGLADVVVYKPDGTILLPTFGFWGTGGGTPSFVLPVSGNYSIVVNPFYHWTGNITVTVSEDLSPPISIGGPSVPLDLNRPGQNGYLTFSGTAGQRVSVGMSDVTIAQGICCPNGLGDVVVYKPDGTILLPAFGFWGTGGGTPSFVLPVSGDYSIVVNPFYHWTGNITVTVSEDLSPPISIGGPSVPLTFRAGQNGYLNFTGNAGQRVSLGMTDVTIAQGVCCPNELASVVIYKPDGTMLLSPHGFGAGGGGTPTVLLPANGNYSIEVNPNYHWLGNITVTLSEDLSPPISIGGPPVSLDHRPGQNSYVTFSGTAGQRVSIGISNVTVAQGVCCPSSLAEIFIYKPDGTPILSSFGFGAGGAGTASFVLPVSGNYSIAVNPFYGWMGNVTLTVSEDLSPPIAINDPAVVLNFDRAGQNAYLTFSGTASQQVTVRITGNTTGNMAVALLNSGGSTLTSTSSGGVAFNLSTITLPTTGIYAIRIDPSGTNTGTANVAVTNP